MRKVHVIWIIPRNSWEISPRFNALAVDTALIKGEVPAAGRLVVN